LTLEQARGVTEALNRERAVVNDFSRTLSDPTRLALLDFLSGEEHTVSDCVELVNDFFCTLSDPTRLALLDFLLGEEHTVSECMEHVGLSQRRVSVHLGCLADCGYVSARREGRYTYYRLTDSRVADLIALTRTLAANNWDLPGGLSPHADRLIIQGRS
jgi:ArsR family transcriptional regulator, cadmium/lead-responsive transcriptional repressor